VQTADHAAVVSVPGESLRVSGATAGATALCQGVIDETGAPLTEGGLTERMRDGDSLARLGAPFAALLVDGHGPQAEATIAADHIGLRHVYGTSCPAFAAAGTSARSLAASAGGGIDLAALSVFRLAGHYLDSDTAYAGVSKLPAAHYWKLSGGRLALHGYPQKESWSGPDPTAAHAERLRELVAGFLSAHDEVMLELSGGLDSRLVLASVPPQRRRKLTAFTIVAAGSKDGPVAAKLARHFGMRFEVVRVAALQDLSPAQAYEMTVAAAVRQDGLGRPLSAAAFDWAESQVRQGPRLSGHGGELARAIFEFERPHPTVRKEVVDNYIRRWITSNDAVKDVALTPEFAGQSTELAMPRLREVFQRNDTDWLSAISVFYLRQRMHRWAGITITDGCRSRVTLNPLMDAEVLRFSMAVPARLRSGSRYVVRVLDRLDPELARIPLGSGLRPVALDRPVTLTRKLGENSWKGFLAKAGSKVIRTISSQRRAAAGAPVLADLVVARWREDPSLLDPVVKTGLINEDWLAQLMEGTVQTDATTVDFLINLGVIAG
jgi:asparagine synthase (glutamine-hydrolysing)